MSDPRELDLSPIVAGNWTLSFGEVGTGWYDDPCVVASLINSKSGEIREQMVYLYPPLTKTWRETARRRMERALAEIAADPNLTEDYDFLTPLTIIPHKAPNYKVYYYHERAGACGRPMRLYAESPEEAKESFLRSCVQPELISKVHVERIKR